MILSSAFLRTKLVLVRGSLSGEYATSFNFPQEKTVQTSPKWSKRLINWGLNLIIVFSLVILGAIYLPAWWGDISSVQSKSDLVPAVVLNPSPAPTAYLPAQDSSLPTGQWLVIPKIGVKTQPLIASDSAQALDKGVWWVADFGRPGDEVKPIIMAAHRFGWKWWWDSDYGKLNSFYYLPELEVGDQIELISDQRKWVYEIYKVEEGEEISDYRANLILYTCKYLSSPTRYFRYAKLVRV